MTSLFISYSRKDINFARKLTKTLEGQDLDFWIDWEGIPPTVDWWKEIEKGIEEADNFLFLLSPDSIASEVCKQEIEHALQNGKRLIPIVVRDIKAEEAPSELSHLNWIFFRKDDDFNESFEKLIAAIKTDYEWVQIHRRLQMRALEWERRNKDNSFLLRGTDLQEAEAQLVANVGKDPKATALQTEYVLKSKKATDRQRRITTGIAIVVVIALAGLTLFGFVQANNATNQAATAQANEAIAQTSQANAEFESLQRATAQADAESNAEEAQRQARIARAGELVAYSESFRESNFPLSMLLSVEAGRAAETSRSSGNTLQILQTDPQLLGFFFGYIELYTIAFNPDGKILASGGCIKNEDNFCVIGEIILWDVETGLPIGQPLDVDQYTIYSVAFSPDGKVLASGGCKENDNFSCNNGEIILWDVETGLPIGQPLDVDQNRIYSVAFSPDGKTLASGGTSRSADSAIILWDVETGQPIGQPFSGTLSSVYSIAFSPDGETLASNNCSGTHTNGVCIENEIILWKIETGQPIGQPLISGLSGRFTFFDFSPDGKTLVSRDTDGNIIFWDISALPNINVITDQFIGQPIKVGSGHIAFNPNGKNLAFHDSDGAIILWDIEAGQPIGKPLGDGIIAFSPSGELLVSASFDGTISLWDVSDITNTRLEISQSLSYHKDSVISVSFSSNGKELASGSTDGTIILWDVEAGLPISQQINAGQDSFGSAAFSPDGKMVATGNADNTVILWDIENGQPIGEPLRGHTHRVYSIAFSPDGEILASTSCKPKELGGCEKGDIILWDVKTGQLIGQPLSGQGVANFVIFSPDGKTLASNGWGGIVLWDVETGRSIRLPLSGFWGSTSSSLAFSPDGQRLAIAGENSTIFLWDVKTGQSTGESLGGANGHDELVTSVTFSSDGKQLASGSADGTIILWDVETGLPISPKLSSGQGSINSMAFSQDGRKLVSRGESSTIVLWNIDFNSWLEMTCQRIWRNFTRVEWARYFPGDEYRKTCDQWPLEPEVIP